MRRHHLGHVDAVLGVGVAVLAVLLLRLAGGGGVHVPQQPLHVARCGGGPLRHPPLHRPGPAPGPLRLQRPADVPEQPGLPAGLLDAHAAVDAARSRRRATPQTRALADPAVFSTVKILGTACSNEQEGSGFVVGPGPGGDQRPRGGRRDQRQHPGARSGTPPTTRRRCSSTPRSTSPSCAPTRRSARRSPSTRTWWPRGTPGRDARLSRGRAAAVDPAGVTEEITAIGKDIYNSGSVTRDVYALDANVAARQLGRSAAGARRPGHRGRLLPLDRLPERRLRPGLAGGPGPGAGGRSRHRLPRWAPGCTADHVAEDGKNEAMSQPIEDYAVIGDLHTAALVGQRRVDRLALPAALRLAVLLRPAPRRRDPRLLADRAGRRRGRASWRPGAGTGPDSLVLETEFDTADGHGPRHRLHAGPRQPSPCGALGRGRQRHGRHAHGSGRPLRLRRDRPLGHLERRADPPRRPVPTRSPCGTGSTRSARTCTRWPTSP